MSSGGFDPMTDETPLGDQLVDFNGETMAIKDIPDPVIRTMLGYGHANDDKRSVVVVEGRTWESTPDVCTFGDGPWEWARGIIIYPANDQGTIVGEVDEYLVCPKCGLDGT